MEVDSRPMKLRPEDTADDIPAQLFALAGMLRTQNAEMTYLLSILRDTSRDVGRRIYLAEAQGGRILETTARTRDSLEVLTRTLRAAGRL